MIMYHPFFPTAMTQIKELPVNHHPLIYRVILRKKLFPYRSAYSRTNCVRRIYFLRP